MWQYPSCIINLAAVTSSCYQQIGNKDSEHLYSHLLKNLHPIALIHFYTTKSEVFFQSDPGFINKTNLGEKIRG